MLFFRHHIILSHTFFQAKNNFPEEKNQSFGIYLQEIFALTSRKLNYNL